jgi:hypothetical protein
MNRCGCVFVCFHIFQTQSHVETLPTVVKKARRSNTSMAEVPQVVRKRQRSDIVAKVEKVCVCVCNLFAIQIVYNL